MDSWLIAGFLTFEEASEQLTELAEDDGRAPGPEIAALAARWDARVEEQGAWTSRSDADRLEAAFSALETRGVAARMNFSCCGSCAPGDLAREVADDPTRRGYVYFHAQDAEGLVRGSVYLGYGALGRFTTAEGEPDRDRYGRSAVAVGAEVVSALREHGLDVDWDGDLARRILVRVPDWRRAVHPR